VAIPTVPSYFSYVSPVLFVFATISWPLQLRSLVSESSTATPQTEEPPANSVYLASNAAGSNIPLVVRFRELDIGHDTLLGMLASPRAALVGAQSVETPAVASVLAVMSALQQIASIYALVTDESSWLPWASLACGIPVFLVFATVMISRSMVQRLAALPAVQVRVALLCILIGHAISTVYRDSRGICYAIPLLNSGLVIFAQDALVGEAKTRTVLWPMTFFAVAASTWTLVLLAFGLVANTVDLRVGLFLGFTWSARFFLYDIVGTHARITAGLPKQRGLCPVRLAVVGERRASLARRRGPRARARHGHDSRQGRRAAAFARDVAVARDAPQRCRGGIVCFVPGARARPRAHTADDCGAYHGG